MPLLETIVSPFPPGSARKMDYTFPDWNANNTGNVTNAIRDRPGAQAANPAGSISTGATGSVNVGVVQGISCVRLVNGVNLNGGPTLIVDGAGRFHLNTLAANVKFSFVTDDYGVHRVYALMWVAATPTDVFGDCGLQVINSTNAGSSIIQGGKPGIGFQFDTAGGIGFLMKGNSLATTTTPLATAAQGFVNTVPHMCEFRFIPATATQNGFVKVYLDNVLKLTKNYGSVADDLPLPSTVGANVNDGWVVNIQNQGRNSELDLALCRLQRGPTEQAVIS